LKASEARDLLIKVCRLGWQKGFFSATDGNLSLRLKKNRLLITPAGRSKALLEPEDLVEMDLEGGPSQGEGQASAELELHLAVYQELPQVRAVVHAHPPLATAFSLAGRELDLSPLPEAMVVLGRAPTVPYATPGSRDLVRAVKPFLSQGHALLLANHGTLAYGPDLESAWARTEKLESAAQALYAATAWGGARPLPPAEQERLLALGGHDRPDDDLPPLAERIEQVHLPESPDFATEKRWQDARGQAHLIVDDKPLRRICLLTIKPDAGARGNHVHARKHEGFYVVSGRGRVEMVCIKTGERLSLEQVPGDRLWLPPGVAHRIIALGSEPLCFVEFTDQPYDKEDDIAFDF
jgi:L-fuculose-phosphate aldolase